MNLSLDKVLQCLREMQPGVCKDRAGCMSSVKENNTSKEENKINDGRILGKFSNIFASISAH